MIREIELIPCAEIDRLISGSGNKRFYGQAIHPAVFAIGKGIQEETKMPNKVTDLRSALDLLRTMPGQLMETDVEVEPMAELSGVYRYVGAGGTVMRPTKEGPAMIFGNVLGHPGARVAVGVLASRKELPLCWTVGRKTWEKCSAKARKIPSPSADTGTGTMPAGGALCL